MARVSFITQLEWIIASGAINSWFVGWVNSTLRSKRARQLTQFRIIGRVIGTSDETVVASEETRPAKKRTRRPKSTLATLTTPSGKRLESLKNWNTVASSTPLRRGIQTWSPSRKGNNRDKHGPRFWAILSTLYFPLGFFLLRVIFRDFAAVPH